MDKHLNQGKLFYGITLSTYVFIVLIMVSVFASITFLYANSMWLSSLKMKAYIKTSITSLNFTSCKIFSCCSCLCPCSSEFSGNSSCSIEGNILSVNIANVYPGWRGVIVAVIKNNGTLPLTINSEDVDVVRIGSLARYLSIGCPLILKKSLHSFKKVVEEYITGNTVHDVIVLNPGENAFVLVGLKISKYAGYGLRGYVTIRIDAQPYVGD